LIQDLEVGVDRLLNLPFILEPAGFEFDLFDVQG